MRPPPPAYPLEPATEQLDAWLAATGRVLHDHLAQVHAAPAHGRSGAEAWRAADALAPPIAEAPLAGGLDAALATVAAAAELALNTIGPGYLAYVPGGGVYAAALGSFLADGLNRFTGLAAAAPGFARLEADVLAWLCRELGLPPASSGGLFTTGGSLANFAAVVAARHQRFGDTDDLRGATCYASDQTHRAVAKALRLAGLGGDVLRAVRTDAALRLDPAALDAALREDLARGRRPFLVVANAGTTNTGAIDPLDAIADVCASHGVWLHVDGAYGGFFVLCDEGRRRLSGIERADSVAVDPHKGMFLPYGLGALLVRDRSALAAAHADSAAYLQDLAGEDPLAVPSPSDLGPELSREFRGLKLWLPLMVHGVAPFRAAVAEKLALAQRLREGLAGLPLEVPLEPQLSVVAFRLPRLGAEEPLDAWSARNRALLDAIHAHGRVYLSSTLLPVEDGDVFTLRACVLSFRTHADRIEAALEDVRAALATMARQATRRPG